MTKIKRGFFGITTASMMLILSVSSLFAVQQLFKDAIGWTPPYWLAVAIDVLAVGGAIVTIVASCGVTIPLWLGIAAAGCVGAAA
jgi:hypothetical protein